MPSGVGRKVWFGRQIRIHAFSSHKHCVMGAVGNLGKWH